MNVQADQFQISINWFAERALVAGRRYFLLLNSQVIPFSVTAIKYRKHDITGEHLSAKRINKKESGVINISVAESIAANTGDAFNIVDVGSNEILGRGLFDFVLHRSTNIRWQQLSIDQNARAQLKQQKALCIWFTGLSGSGKSTIANLLEKRLFDEKLHTYLLDGDNLRHGLNRDLGFTEADRVENIRRVSEVARLMVDAGLIVIASFISPYSSERLMARKLFLEHEFIEVFVDTPLSECEKRDVKGLYAKARRGELKNFTGIDSAYERPEHPELVLDTCSATPENCVQHIFEYLQSLPAVKKT
jgi:bifunctional enzyme CysN/CysC